jgi:hypothetical protein
MLIPGAPWGAILILAVRAATGAPAADRHAGVRELEGEYGAVYAGEVSRTTVALRIRDSSYVCSTTTAHREWRDIIVQAWRIRRLRDDLFMLSEQSFDSYQLDGKGAIDRRFGTKFGGQLTWFKTIKRSGDTLTERIASVLTGGGPGVEGRWVQRFRYRKDSVTVPESTVIEIARHEIKTLWPFPHEPTKDSSSISKDTLVWYRKDGTAKFTNRYQIANDTLFMESVAPVITYTRGFPARSKSDSAR